VRHQPLQILGGALEAQRRGARQRHQAGGSLRTTSRTAIGA
jgi:hypothetical protein